MPSYNYICKTHGNFTMYNSMADRAFAQCPNCAKMAEQTVCSRPAAVHEFNLGEFHDIDLVPVYARNKKELRSLCERFDCYAPGALD